ncbi:MAG: rhodanese-like domain-containing protein [Methanothrix sp.]|nr:rhodanese-like domain-containing protein [Methanothrix sp.]
MKKKIVLIVLSLVFIFSYASAENLKSITADKLKNMLDKKTKLVLVDARPQQEFSQGHIPSSVNIPPDKVGSISTLLPKNKKIIAVFYCRGVG